MAVAKPRRLGPDAYQVGDLVEVAYRDGEEFEARVHKKTVCTLHVRAIATGAVVVLSDLDTKLFLRHKAETPT